MVVVKRALDFELFLQITLKLPVDVVHHWLIAARQTKRSDGIIDGKYRLVHNDHTF